MCEPLLSNGRVGDTQLRGIGDCFAASFSMEDLFALPEPLSVIGSASPEAVATDVPPWLKNSNNFQLHEDRLDMDFNMRPRRSGSPPRLGCLSEAEPGPCTPSSSGNPLEDRTNTGPRTPRMRTPRMRKNAVGSPTLLGGSLKTPKNTVSPTLFGGCMKTPQQNTVSPTLLQSVQTPEARKTFGCSPPSGPGTLHKRLEEDIDAAVSLASMPLLALALRRGHCCDKDHMVFEAVRRQNMPSLRFVLESGDQDVDQTCCGKRPLHLALENCYIREDTGYKMAELLLRHGANPNALPQDTAVGLTSPLHDATRRGCSAVLELLLRFGVDPNVGDEDGLTSMHVFARKLGLFPISCYKEILSCLLAHDASPFVLDAHGRTPLDGVNDVNMRCVIVRVQRWWTRKSILQVSRAGGERADALESVRPWMLPEIFRAIMSFVSA